MLLQCFDIIGREAIEPEVKFSLKSSNENIITIEELT